MSTVSSVGERALIERLRARVGAAPAWVTTGIGDDAAVLVPERGTSDVITTDSLVEGVHFRRDWTSARATGHKALATSLSDLAAMGASPRASLLSLALPAGLPLEEFDGLVDGFTALAAREGAPLVGGNITRSPGPLVIDTTAVGSVRPRRVLRRGGGRPGDELYVTGAIGAAATGLAILSSGAGRDGLSADLAACVARYEAPEARVRAGLLVGRSRAAHACMDLSDGLADAAAQIAEASGTGVVIDAGALPIHPGAAAWAGRDGRDPVAGALAGGEDYELLFAIAPKGRRAFFGALRHCTDLPVKLVGRLTREPGAWLERAGGREPLGRGFVHF